MLPVLVVEQRSLHLVMPILESFLGNTESNPIVISFKSDSSGSNKPNVINVDNRTYKPCKKATSGYA